MSTKPFHTSDLTVSEQQQPEQHIILLGHDVGEEEEEGDDEEGGEDEMRLAHRRISSTDTRPASCASRPPASIHSAVPLGPGEEEDNEENKEKEEVRCESRDGRRGWVR
ncbi:hypothetical protein C0J45_19720 [Silurus meridionalis]|nr:hypothetical protein C0J45_19720 [Silurus meridionalis]